VRITIDTAKCQGHNVCLGFIPDMLDVDADGYPAVTGNGEVAPAQAKIARQAAENCPEQAISLLDSP
jgi:ferredoxin